MNPQMTSFRSKQFVSGKRFDFHVISLRWTSLDKAWYASLLTCFDACKLLDAATVLYAAWGLISIGSCE